MRTHIFGPKWPNCPKSIFFRKTINIISMSLFAPFIVQHCKTILTADPELWGSAILGLKWPICPKHDFFWKSHQGHSMSDGPKFRSLGHEPSQILVKPDERYIWDKIILKVQHKLITHSKVITPQSWHGKLKIGKTRGGQAAWMHFWVSITFFVLNPNFSNLLHCFCA